MILFIMYLKFSLFLYYLMFPNLAFTHSIGDILDDPNASNSDNPDTYLSPTQIIRRNGYPAESHIVQSEDGYLLDVHRIPHGKIYNLSAQKKIPILLHHGILSCSIDWIINGPEKSLGYLLADRGYDIWLGNARGNTYSRGHISKNPKDEAFWNFSFHESGVSDLPAIIDFILNKTNSEQLIYIGHSMGTTIFYVMCAERPEYNKKIKIHIGLAPVAFLTHTTSVIRHVVPYAKKIQKISDWYNKGAFLEHDLLMRWASKLLCGREVFNINLCEQYIIFTLFGKDPKEFDLSLLPIMIGHMPAGTAGKTLIHYSQMYKADKFQHFDYGITGNIKIYNQSTPPLYDLSKITAPVALYYGKNDILADYRDVIALYQKLPNPVSLIGVKYELFNHIDFLVSIDINLLLNNQILDLINKTGVPGYLEEQINIEKKTRFNVIGEGDVEKYNRMGYIPDKKLFEWSSKTNPILSIEEYEILIKKHKELLEKEKTKIEDSNSIDELIKNDEASIKKVREVGRSSKMKRRIDIVSFNEQLPAMKYMLGNSLVKKSNDWNKKIKETFDKLNIALGQQNNL